MDLFLRKSFLDDKGNPDKTKTLDLIPLPGFADRPKMHATAERIPGLETNSGGYGVDRTVVVGWDSSVVWRVASEIKSPHLAKLRDEEKAE